MNDRFYLSDSDVRGFKYAGIGPRAKSASDDALGGNQYYIFSAEILVPLGFAKEADTKAALFYDAGTLFGLEENNSDNQIHYDKSIRTSIGTGLQWKISPW